MNKKTLIQVIVIVVAFGAAGIVLYNGFFSNSGGTTAETETVQPIDESALLPYGDTLNFKGILYKRPFQYGAVDYPKLNPNSEVGVPVSSLITPLPSAPAAK
ncbi:MAG: hypothetical protein HY918_03910 [Candidatus Doudnabacteria bacterium]|nr:hypothetical protein [Candidatus Doudnabacteria bacterium]